jgi:SAM-dependent methyltransferase
VKCLVCQKDDWDVVHSYDKPDKYEKWMGINDVKRSWEKCACGFHQSRRNYPIEDLQKIYTNGYRDVEFRHRAINEAFQHVVNLPKEESENEQRLKDFQVFFEPGSVLDVGSGLGVFPKRLTEEGYYVWCVEPNVESQRFINDELGIRCVPEMPVYAKFDIITLIHVLEHIVDPVPFLKQIKEITGKALYIEVPDASEFKHLGKGHNEFSSDHVYFYDLPSIIEIVNRAGFKMVGSFYSNYKDRNLTRLTAMCT